MKKIYTTICALLIVFMAGAQTLNVKVGNVIYQFPSTQTGEMTYTDGETLTIMGKVFTLSDITSMSVDDSEVTDNLVKIAYDSSTATVYVAGNVAQYVEPTVTDADVFINQLNTDAIDEDEITYQLEGETTNGSFALSGSYKSTVSLAGVTMTNPNGAAINITNSKRIQLSAKKNTVNSLADGIGAQKACIYSKGQLQIQGNGTLNVKGNNNHAIKSASYVSIKNLTLNITSAIGDGINCEEYFLMKNGTVTISGVGDDGLQCDLGGTASTGETTDHEDEDTGNIYLEGGALNITATETAAKCVKSDGSIIVSDGTYTMNAEGALDTTDTSDLSYTTGMKADGDFTQSGGDITVNVKGAAGRGISVNGAYTSSDTNQGTLTIINSGALASSGSTYFATAKGIKAGAVNIHGGTLNITMSGSAAKGMKADSDDGTGTITITGGDVTVNTSGAGAYDNIEKDSKGSCGIKADNNMLTSGGTLTLKSTGSGGKCIKVDGTLNIDGGTISATTTGGTYTYSSNKAQPKAIKSDGNMSISGGDVTANSSGHEAIETKGTLTITNGTVYAFSTSDDAINSASHMYLKGGNVTGVSNKNDGIDSNGNLTISGGKVIACGAGGAECGLDAAERYYLYITGGTVLGIGAGNNTVTSTSGSQCVLATSSSTYTAGTSVSVKNSSTTLASFTIPTGYSPSSQGGGRWAPPGGGGGGQGGSGFSFLVSCNGLTSGSSYTVTIGSTSSSVKASTTYSGR